MLQVKVEPLEQDVDFIIRDDLSPQAQSKNLALFARQKVHDAQKTNFNALGYKPPQESFVDGLKSENFEQVRPDGTIVVEFDLIHDLLRYIDTTLVKYSPRLSGQYIRSHAFFADGVEVPFGEDLPVAREYQFVNTVPYARKIERGHSPQAPEGVYEVVALIARRHYGKLAKIQFSYRSPLTGSVNTWAGSASAKAMAHRVRGGSERLHTDWLTRQPAIVITHR
jgi:hypothetical protein